VTGRIVDLAAVRRARAELAALAAAHPEHINPEAAQRLRTEIQCPHDSTQNPPNPSSSRYASPGSYSRRSTPK
jgi:hypothetical protein